MKDTSSRQMSAYAGRNGDSSVSNLRSAKVVMQSVGCGIGKQQHHSKTGRILALFAGACLLLALGCGMFGSAVHELQTPLNDDTIQSLLLFSTDFQERLQEVEKSFEGRRTVVDGLDVTVTALRRDGEVYLKLWSILRPHGMTILPAAPQRHSVIANGDPSE